jgi:phosphate-selective porin OprO/OprP
MKRNFRSLLIALIGMSLFLGITSMAQAKSRHKTRAASQNSAKPGLQQRIDELEQNQKVLERKWELDKEATEAKEKEKAKESAIVKAGSDGFIIQSADGAYKLRIGGYIQTDGRFFLHDTGDKLANQFVLRRVRPILEGTVGKWFDFRIMPDFGEGKVVLQDAYTDIHPWLFARLRGGKFKEPVGLERLQSGSNLLFIERGLPTNLVPNRDVGFQLHGDVGSGFFNYALGFFNGVFDAGSTDGDASDGKASPVASFSTLQEDPCNRLAGIRTAPAA